MLAAYGRISPDLVNRIVSMAETQVHGRHEVIKSGMEAESFAVRTSAITTSIVAVGGLGASIILLANGMDVGALLTAIPAVLMGIAQVSNQFRKKGDE